MMDWMKQQDDETDYEWVTDMASLVVTIIFIALVGLAMLAGYWMVTR